jgi:hypothetical protein
VSHQRHFTKVRTPRRPLYVSDDPDLSVILPAHNEGPNLRILLPKGLGIEAQVLVVVRGTDVETQAAV